MSLFRGPRTRLAALQMRIEPGRREENLARAAKLLSTAREREADLACLPATFATGLNFPTLRGDATAEDGPVVEFLAEQARTLGMHIAAGVLLAQGRDIYDAAVLIGPGGDPLGWYRRACVWEGEAEYVSTGSPRPVIDTPVGRIGLLVSYDLRFPEASRHYLVQDADLLVCVANLFGPFSHPVRSICRARAADTECALVFASGVGENRFAGMTYTGRSMIVDGLVQDVQQDPEADVLAEAGPDAHETVLHADIHLRQRRKTRAGLPFHDDVRALWTTTHGSRDR
ncbi:carbon-nitrogen hydrolase family protein [Streptomyces sp. SBST2-5]|uniref:Carbon-nitrogen hydrolase family protein n=1 Tax=Streptomyces composti TaxID=2720025 RepID=A0ABX1A4X7_9ACTN|nr:carbon-nitrogen hydrolase family protein [Streptomyces composti]NJP51498.1 carbon-nitrogen hydrolase family protein [Streptomyces composti]